MRLPNIAAFGSLGIVGLLIACACCLICSVIVVAMATSAPKPISQPQASAVALPAASDSTSSSAASALTQVVGAVAQGANSTTPPAAPAPAAATPSGQSPTAAQGGVRTAVPPFRYHNTDAGSFLLVKSDTVAMGLFANGGALQPGTLLQLGGLQSAKSLMDLTAYSPEYRNAIQRANQERPMLTIVALQSVDTYSARVSFSPSLRLPEHCLVTQGVATGAVRGLTGDVLAPSLAGTGAGGTTTGSGPGAAVVFRYHNTAAGLFVIPKSDPTTVALFSGGSGAAPMRPGTWLKLRGLQVAKADSDATRTAPAYLAAVAEANRTEPVIQITGVRDLDQFSVGVLHAPAALQLPEHCVVTQGLIVPPPAGPPAAPASAPALTATGATYRFRIHNTGWRGQFLIPVMYQADLALFEGPGAPLGPGVRVRLSEFRSAKYSGDPTANDPAYLAQIAALNANNPVIQLAGQVTSIDSSSKLVSYTPGTVNLPEHVNVRADVVVAAA